MAYGDWAQWKRRRKKRGHAVYYIQGAVFQSEIESWIARHGKKFDKNLTLQEAVKHEVGR